MQTVGLIIVYQFNCLMLRGRLRTLDDGILFSEYILIGPGAPFSALLLLS